MRRHLPLGFMKNAAQTQRYDMGEGTLAVLLLPVNCFFVSAQRALLGRYCALF